MNFLLHLYLSPDRPEHLVGNFMGDFVKGPLDGRYPRAIAEGVALHRKIDLFAQGHPQFQRSRTRLDAACGRYRGVYVDLFYDHFLAATWDDWSAISFDDWLSLTRRTVERYGHLLPERLFHLLPGIFDELLPSYRTVEGVGRALERMARRTRKPEALLHGRAQLARHYGGLQDDFRLFLPDAREYVRRWMLREHGGVTP